MSDDAVLAGRYFDEEIRPDLERDGMPPEGVAHLRQRYITDACANPAAIREIRERSWWMELLIENLYGLGEMILTSVRVECAPPPPESDADAFDMWVTENITDHTGTGRMIPREHAFYSVTIVDASDPAWVGREFESQDS